VFGKYLILVDNLRFSNVVKIKELGVLFFCVLFGAISHLFWVFLSFQVWVGQLDFLSSFWLFFPFGWLTRFYFALFYSYIYF
jgi:hypothetical protein